MTSAGLMPEGARILSFPNRRPQRLSPAELRETIETFLASAPDTREAGYVRDCYGNPDLLHVLSQVLRNKLNLAPAEVGPEAERAYEWISSQTEDVGLFDERDYFLGEFALLAGGAAQTVGRREDSERWLWRAEAGFRHTVNPAPLLARVAYSRLGLRYEMRRYDEVLELLPSVTRSFATLGMDSELAKSKYLEAVTLKESGRTTEALQKLHELGKDPLITREPRMLGMTLVNLGDVQAGLGEFTAALANYQAALQQLLVANVPFALAHLKATMADTLRRQGQLGSAINAYREAIADYSTLKMSTFAAYIRVLLAETLLQAHQPREAEWEILAALPTIDEEKMVPEGFAAVSLLRESVKQRKTDPNALTEVREYLQAKN